MHFINLIKLHSSIYYGFCVVLKTYCIASASEAHAQIREEVQRKM